MKLTLPAKVNAQCKLQSSRMPTHADFDKVVAELGLNKIGPVFLTGSVKFGCAGPTSDIDVVMLINSKVFVAANLGQEKTIVEESAYNNGFKIMRDDVVVNFLFLHPVDFMAWHMTAEIISRHRLVKPGMNKMLRCGIHESLAAAMKTSLSGEEIDINYATQYFENVSNQKE